MKNKFFISYIKNKVDNRYEKTKKYLKDNINNKKKLETSLNLIEKERLKDICCINDFCFLLEKLDTKDKTKENIKSMIEINI